MTKEQSVELMTDKMAKFVAYVGKKAARRCRG